MPEYLLVNANAYSYIGFLAKVSSQVNDGAASSLSLQRTQRPQTRLVSNI